MIKLRTLVRAGKHLNVHRNLSSYHREIGRVRRMATNVIAIIDKNGYVAFEFSEELSHGLRFQTTSVSSAPANIGEWET